MATIAQRDLARHIQHIPARDIDTYGAMSYTPNGYWTGYLPDRLVRVLSNLRDRQKYIPMVYSYGTPIAWYDAEHGAWVKPDVSYSVTTGKHQSYLWSLSPVRIPADCGIGEYDRYVTRQMIYRGNTTIPGPAFRLG